MSLSVFVGTSSFVKGKSIWLAEDALLFASSVSRTTHWSYSIPRLLPTSSVTLRRSHALGDPVSFSSHGREGLVIHSNLRYYSQRAKSVEAPWPAVMLLMSPEANTLGHLADSTRGKFPRQKPMGSGSGLEPWYRIKLSPRAALYLLVTSGCSHLQGSGVRSIHVTRATLTEQRATAALIRNRTPVTSKNHCTENYAMKGKGQKC